jgi:diacylglycerol kinase family enzyme
VPGDCLAQAKRIRILTNAPLPMQVDGEPVILQPSEINIELLNKATVITSIDKNSIRI